MWMKAQEEKPSNRYGVALVHPIFHLGQAKSQRNLGVHNRQGPKGLFFFHKRGIHDQGDLWKFLLETTVCPKLGEFDLSWISLLWMPFVAPPDTEFSYRKRGFDPPPPPRSKCSMTCIGITAACYRTEKAQIPKSAGESAGKSAGKKGLLGALLGAVLRAAVSMEKQRNGTAPSSPTSSPLFPGTLPSTLPSTFGDLGFLSPVAGGCDS